MTIRVSAFEQRITEVLAKANCRQRSDRRVACSCRACDLDILYISLFCPSRKTTPAREVWNARWKACLSDHTALENMVGFARDHKLLPEAYLYGFAFTNKSANVSARVPRRRME